MNENDSSRRRAPKSPSDGDITPVKLSGDIVGRGGTIEDEPSDEPSTYGGAAAGDELVVDEQGRGIASDLDDINANKTPRRPEHEPEEGNQGETDKKGAA